jgi:hypothetical protein
MKRRNRTTCQKPDREGGQERAGTHQEIMTSSLSRLSETKAALAYARASDTEGPILSAKQICCVSIRGTRVVKSLWSSRNWSFS